MSKNIREIRVKNSRDVIRARMLGIPGYSLGGWIKNNKQGIFGGIQAALGVGAMFIPGLQSVGSSMIGSGVGNIAQEVSGDIAARNMPTQSEIAAQHAREQLDNSIKQDALKTSPTINGFMYGGLYADGGFLYGAQEPNAELQGGETFQEPDGGIYNIPDNYPSHEQGGVKMALDSGTRMLGALKSPFGKSYQEEGEKLSNAQNKLLKIISGRSTPLAKKSALKGLEQVSKDYDLLMNLQELQKSITGVDNDGVSPDDVEFKNGGIYIKPSKRGTFTAAAKRHGMSVQAFARKVLANKSNYSSAMVKKANFARNASKWKHEYGGIIGYEDGGNVTNNPVKKGPNSNNPNYVPPPTDTDFVTDIYGSKILFRGDKIREKYPEIYNTILNSDDPNEYNKAVEFLTKTEGYSERSPFKLVAKETERRLSGNFNPDEESTNYTSKYKKGSEYARFYNDWYNDRHNKYKDEALKARNLFLTSEYDPGYGLTSEEYAITRMPDVISAGGVYKNYASFDQDMANINARRTLEERKVNIDRQNARNQMGAVGKTIESIKHTKDVVNDKLSGYEYGGIVKYWKGGEDENYPMYPYIFKNYNDYYPSYSNKFTEEPEKVQAATPKQNPTTATTTDKKPTPKGKTTTPSAIVFPELKPKTITAIPMPVRYPKHVPTDIKLQRSGYEEDEQGVDFGDIASNIGIYAPIAYNIGRGLFSKPDRINENRYNNAYEGRILGQLQDMRYNIEPQLEQNRLAQAAYNTNVRNVSPGAGQYLANLGAGYASRMRADAAAYAAKQNVENSYRQASAQIMNNLGQQRSQNLRYVDSYNKQAEANKRNQLATGLGQLQQALQTSKYSKNLQQNDILGLMMLGDMFRNYDISDEGYELLNKMLGKKNLKIKKGMFKVREGG